MITLVIFDLDGTLVNAYPAVCSSVNYTLQCLGFPKRTYAQVKSAVGLGDRQLMAQFTGEAMADQALAMYRRHHAKALTTGVRCLSGTRVLLKFLKSKGCRLAIASNRPTKFTRIILDQMDIRRYFDMVLCGDRVQRPKPHPDMLLQIARTLDVPVSQSLYVGDMGIDVIAGRRAGMRTVAVATGSSTIKELKGLQPMGILTKINQLRRFL